jgi:hypothetical protein
MNASLLIALLFSLIGGSSFAEPNYRGAKALKVASIHDQESRLLSSSSVADMDTEAIELLGQQQR